MIGIGIVVTLFLFFVLSLNWLTHHGEAKTVPTVVGKRVDDARNFLETQGFELVIQDSVYIDTLPPSFVIKQVPEPDAVVKINRNVYLTVNRVVPPDVDMPNLIGYTFRNAEMILKNLGLKLGDTSYKPDFAKNSVLEQSINGRLINPGTRIRMGSSISLVIGKGVGIEDMAVPKLVGLTYREGRFLLEGQGLIVGSVIPDPLVKDTGMAFIYRQSPQAKTEDGFKVRIRPGQMIDVWLSIDKPVTDSLSNTKPLDESTTEE